MTLQLWINVEHRSELNSAVEPESTPCDALNYSCGQQDYHSSVESAPPKVVKSPTVHRIFQKYSSEDRSNRAASRRMGHVQRIAVGEFFYTSDLIPNRAFDTRGQAQFAESEFLRTQGVNL